MFVIEKDSFQQLFNVLKEKGYEIIGPTVEDAAIVYDTITSFEDLPIGWTDQQDAGTYRLKRRKDKACFGYALGPTSWKKYLYPPAQKLWEAKRTKGDFRIEAVKEESKRALIGVRSCELHAIHIQDKVFLGGFHVDSCYRSRRAHALIIAVNCTEAGGTCFCASMNTGPKVVKGFDLSLTEIIDQNRHYFLIETGSRKGEDLLKEIPHRPANKEQKVKCNGLMGQAVMKMGRKMDTPGIKNLLYENLQHSQWEEIAVRCLSCANCTMVCPTCFCSNVEEVTDLTGDHAERWKQWDSCFNADFSYIHGGSVRNSVKSRYRQWLTHKLASWIDQLGSSGCVGCGRCITWCPVGIDITEEIREIKKTSKPGEVSHGRS